jgi:hypothetical protein
MKLYLHFIFSENMIILGNDGLKWAVFNKVLDVLQENVEHRNYVKVQSQMKIEKHHLCHLIVPFLLKLIRLEKERKENFV